jgi:hypothetical protein
MNFNRLAPFYRAMEVIVAGGKLQRCWVALLGEIPAPAEYFWQVKDTADVSRNAYGSFQRRGS